jgi:hypothetical protein
MLAASAVHATRGSVQSGHPMPTFITRPKKSAETKQIGSNLLFHFSGE